MQKSAKVQLKSTFNSSQLMRSDINQIKSKRESAKEKLIRIIK
jgi:hypothetical protein